VTTIYVAHGPVPAAVRKMIERYGAELEEYEKSATRDMVVLLVAHGGEEHHGLLGAADVAQLKEDPEIAELLGQLSSPSPAQMIVMVLIEDVASVLLVARRMVELQLVSGGRA